LIFERFKIPNQIHQENDQFVYQIQVPIKCRKNSFIVIILEIIMGLFTRKKELVVGNICPKCDMEFSDSQRTVRHMEKAHKSKKKFECNSCG